jgi:low affinity Fe/Cu permease
MLKFDTSNQDNILIHLKLNEELLEEETRIKLLGIETDKSLNWKTQVKSMLPR